MADFQLLSAFLIGVAGSVHCVGMCGGIVSAFGMFTPKDQPKFLYLIAYNLGRISSYTLAGAITAWLGTLISSQLWLGMQWLSLLSGFFLLLLACYIGNWWPVLQQLEKLGSVFFRLIRPLSKTFLPMKSPLYAVPYGFIWGWLPCGLVYSTLSWSLVAGNPMQGGLTMLAFGLGTLPSMLAVGASMQSVKSLMQQTATRQIIALLLCLFGLIILSRAIFSLTSLDFG